MLGEEIKRKVVVKLEEFSPYAPEHEDAGPLLSGQDKLEEVKPIYSYIDETLPQAANEVLLVAPLNKLEPEHAEHRVCVHSQGRIGTISLPDDYLRLYALRMETWTAAVRVAQHPGSPLAYAQDNEWTMGTPQKPVVIQEHNVLRYYSVAPSAAIDGEAACENAHKIEMFKYIPVFSEVGEYSENVAEVIALNCAKKIFEMFQNAEGVTAMSNEIKSALEALSR